MGMQTDQSAQPQTKQTNNHKFELIIIRFHKGTDPHCVRQWQSSAENNENAKNYQKLMTELPQHFLLLQLREVDFSWWT